MTLKCVFNADDIGIMTASDDVRKLAEGATQKLSKLFDWMMVNELARQN